MARGKMVRGMTDSNVIELNCSVWVLNMPQEIASPNQHLRQIAPSPIPRLELWKIRGTLEPF